MSGMYCCSTPPAGARPAQYWGKLWWAAAKVNRVGGGQNIFTFLLVAEVSLMVDLRAELGTGESLSPLASDLAREDEEERREAEHGGSTWWTGLRKRTLRKKIWDIFPKISCSLNNFGPHWTFLLVSYLWGMIPKIFNDHRERAEACPHPTHARPHPALRVWQMRWRDHLEIFFTGFLPSKYLHRRLHIFKPPHILNASLWNKSKLGYFTEYHYFITTAILGESSNMYLANQKTTCEPEFINTVGSSKIEGIPIPGYSRAKVWQEGIIPAMNQLQLSISLQRTSRWCTNHIGWNVTCTTNIAPESTNKGYVRQIASTASLHLIGHPMKHKCIYVWYDNQTNRTSTSAFPWHHCKDEQKTMNLYWKHVIIESELGGDQNL